MVFTPHQPAPPLTPLVKLLWHVHTSEPRMGMERVLPTGQAELVLNLAADRLTACDGFGDVGEQSPALLVGVRPVYTTIYSADLRELMGAVFAPGSLPFFFAEPADRLGGEIDLSALWGIEVAALRECLRNTPHLPARFGVLEAFLLRKLRPHSLHPAVQAELARIGGRHTAMAPSGTGLSARRTRQFFAESVGVGPKAFARIRRFRQAMVLLHRGTPVPWAQVALDLGYYDQAHFNADFRAFSGVCPSVYLGANRTWPNHVPLEGSAGN